MNGGSEPGDDIRFCKDVYKRDGRILTALNAGFRLPSASPQQAK